MAHGMTGATGLLVSYIAGLFEERNASGLSR
jgi:hypothetical protein